MTFRLLSSARSTAATLLAGLVTISSAGAADQKIDFNRDIRPILSGKCFANGVPVTPNSLTSVSAYVQQDDLFIGTLTVRETLMFQV